MKEKKRKGSNVIQHINDSDNDVNNKSISFSLYTHYPLTVTAQNVQHKHIWVKKTDLQNKEVNVEQSPVNHCTDLDTETSKVIHTDISQESDSNNTFMLPSPVKATAVQCQQFSADPLLIKYAQDLQKVKEMIRKKEELNYLKDQVSSREDEEGDDDEKDKTIISADSAPSPSSDSNSEEEPKSQKKENLTKSNKEIREQNSHKGRW